MDTIQENRDKIFARIESVFIEAGEMARNSLKMMLRRELSIQVNGVQEVTAAEGIGPRQQVTVRIIVERGQLAREVDDLGRLTECGLIYHAEYPLERIGSRLFEGL